MEDDVIQISDLGTAIDTTLAEGNDEGELSINEKDRLIIEKADRSLSEFYRWRQAGRVILDPSWQRKFVWDKRRSSQLVESFLLDIPVPVVYLARNKENKYEVIDGVQRLTSIFLFMKNELVLKGLEVLKDLNGKSFKDLDDAMQNKFRDATLRTFELTPETSQNLLFLIFQRLNTGGIQLNEMEIRNCIYRGDLNDLLPELAKDKNFQEVVNQSNIDKRMVDRALVLRFLAFYEKTPQKAKEGMKNFLNDFMSEQRNLSDKKSKEYKKVFKHCMRASLTVFGTSAFRLRRQGRYGTQINSSLFQVVTTSFSEYDIGQITRRADSINEALIDLMDTDEAFVRGLSQATGGFAPITYTFDTWRSRLKAVMSSEPPNDKKRFFSKKLKEEMYASDKSCAICNQEIKTINDAALDHDVHYWKGGLTVPENARLTHRLCNLKKSNA
ncbi:DUF262 domain-containing protein [Deinococcus sp. JMULE3]|uniref:GmrSD restriction endonuclease domain-containing protein n=1 Tax=Deinococcus sp. JMULE3 TaxID=2518341 RepID=UPI00157513EF|nr:DUF262 domain-containing protein [Deinococcus sp. JMULE3]